MYGGRLSVAEWRTGPDGENWLWPKADREQWELGFARLRDLIAAMEFVAHDGVAVQAGGNMGVWPDYLGSKFATVYTFEPDPLNFRCLCANVPEENVFKFNAGLRDVPFCHDMRRTENCGAHELAGAGAIPALCLDAFNLPGLDFLQLDVEGDEALALTGGEDLIRRFHPVIMIEDKAFKRRAIEQGKGLETASSECSRLLRSWGYDIAAAFTENGSCDFVYTWRG